jgi:hypothetical protein
MRILLLARREARILISFCKVPSNLRESEKQVWCFIKINVDTDIDTYGQISEQFWTAAKTDLHK